MVQVVDPPAGMRPGMTAKVAIRVETIPGALQVPVQAVMERDGKHYCLVRSGAAIAPRHVTLGSTNEKFLVVRSGLSANDEVLMNPKAHLGNLPLPAAEPGKAPEIAAEKKPAEAAPEAATQARASLRGPGS